MVFVKKLVKVPEAKTAPGYMSLRMLCRILDETLRHKSKRTKLLRCRGGTGDWARHFAASGKACVVRVYERFVVGFSAIAVEHQPRENWSCCRKSLCYFELRMGDTGLEPVTPSVSIRADFDMTSTESYQSTSSYGSDPDSSTMPKQGQTTPI
jgi:hypothetical protein